MPDSAPDAHPLTVTRHPDLDRRRDPRRRTWARVVGILAAATVGVGLLAACEQAADTSDATSGAATTGSGSGPSSDSNPIRVVAAENFWGDIVTQLGGSKVDVTSIISDPNADPHEYETNAHDAAALAKADLVIENGLGYDDFMDKLLSASGRSARTVLSVQDVLNITGSDANPHIWYDTARLPTVTAAITADLSRIDPADAARFQANKMKFDASLAPILAVIAQIKARYDGTPIAYTERVPGYLVQAAGLTLGIPASFAQSIEDGNEPSPADTAKFNAALQHHTVKVLLYNGQVIDDVTTRIKQLATSSGVPIVGVTETLPKGQTFQSWQLGQDQQLLTALAS